MAKPPASCCRELKNDHIQYGAGFVRKLTKKFSETTRSDEQRSSSATTTTNCSLCTAGARCNDSEGAASLFIPNTCETNHNNCSNVVLFTSSSMAPTVSDLTSIPTGKSTDKFTNSSTMQLAVSWDMSKDGECRADIVANTRKLFESLSPSKSTFPCRHSPASSKSTLVTRQNARQALKSEALSSGYISLSAVTTSGNPDEFSDNTVTSADFTADTDASDDVCVGLSDTDTSLGLSVASSCDSVSRDEVYLVVESDGASDEVNQLQTDHQMTTLYSRYDSSSGCIRDVNSAVISDKYQGNLLGKNQYDSLKDALLREETATMRFDDSPSKHETERQINKDVYETSTSEYDVFEMLFEIEDCKSTNLTVPLVYQ